MACTISQYSASRQPSHQAHTLILVLNDYQASIESQTMPSYLKKIMITVEDCLISGLGWERDKEPIWLHSDWHICASTH